MLALLTGSGLTFLWSLGIGEDAGFREFDLILDRARLWSI